MTRQCGSWMARAAAGLIVVFVFLGGCSSGAEITSDTDACAIDIEDGLERIAALNRLQFNVRQGDGQTVIDEGSITKDYRRRGVRHEVSFRPETSNDDCDLVFYRHVEREQGSRHSSSGTLASHTLDACTCEDKD